MSLADQSQQFYPTSIQVTVHQGRNLRIKGKNGTNDAYAIMQVAKDKFSTSVAEKCVAPIWKEEATFDLPLFHQSNADRCTLHVIVMHRAQVGLDKHLGQAVINLLDLHENKSRQKTDWYKLVDKNGKEDKARGEVLLDIQFMRNNMSASMFDLSMHDKPRSRMAKLKDKVRGKKKDGFSDSASAIVPSVSKNLTDSEGEEDAQSLNQSPGVKKKSKLKSLFAPKSNLQRNVSQSMSTLGTLPEKNSSLGGSRASGLNADSPEVKKKFKFLAHKRTGSSDSKVSLGPFSLLGRPKQSANDQNSLCINGNHVYAEENEPKTSSTLSLNSSGQGSAEDAGRRGSDLSVESLKALPVPTHQGASAGRDEAAAEQQRRRQEEDERRQAEEKRMAEDRKLQKEEEEEEEERRQHQEEQERRRRSAEDEARKRRLREEEEAEKRRREEEQRRRLEEERQRAEAEHREREEARRAEERKQQEDASMTDRISSLFGMNRKKEEKKEEAQQSSVAVAAPKTAPRGFSKELEVPGSHSSSNPFEEIALSPAPLNPFESPVDPPKALVGPQTPSASVFLNRTAKVSAVKPRQSQPPPPSPTRPETSPSSVPESPDTFADLHTSLAPPKPRRSSSESPRGSAEDLSRAAEEAPPPTMADKKRRAPPAPAYGAAPSSTEPPSRSYMEPIREIENPAYVEPAGLQLANRPPVPLPDYDTLFPQKRHGVQGRTQWDHIIAEVNQKKMDNSPQFIGREMSVDGPEEPALRRGSKPSERVTTERVTTERVTTERTALRPGQAPQALLPPGAPVTSSWKKTPAPAPPVAVDAPNVRQASESVPNPSRSAQASTERPAAPASSGPVAASRDVRRVPSATAAVVREPELPRAGDDRREAPVGFPKETPTAKPRQKAGGKETVEMAAPTSTTPLEDRPKTGRSSALDRRNTAEEEMSKKAILEKITKAKERFVEPDPFPSEDLLPKDPWAEPQMAPGGDSFVRDGLQKDTNHPLDQGMTPDDLDGLFSRETHQTDPFAGDSDDSVEQTPAFQRGFSSRRKKRQPPARSLSKEAAVSRYTAPKEDTAVPTPVADSLRLEPVADVPNQHTLYDRSRAETVVKAEPAAADPFAPSLMPSVQAPVRKPPPAAVEDGPSQNGGATNGKTTLEARVSPSEVQSLSGQTGSGSNGSGLASTPRRPHPVKPMSSESQLSSSTPAGRDIKGLDNTAGKPKVAVPLECGPYSQLTQEELITMVVKQQGELTKKDAKIVELEEYIDNLIVKVIEEKPTILMSLTSGKDAM